MKATKTLDIAVPFVQGAQHGVNSPSTSEAVAEKFTAKFQRVILGEVGHFPTSETPQDVAALMKHFNEFGNTRRGRLRL